jgi:hypothetical protein
VRLRVGKGLGEARGQLLRHALVLLFQAGGEREQVLRVVGGHEEDGDPVVGEAFLGELAGGRAADEAGATRRFARGGHELGERMIGARENQAELRGLPAEGSPRLADSLGGRLEGVGARRSSATGKRWHASPLTVRTYGRILTVLP